MNLPNYLVGRSQSGSQKWAWGRSGSGLRGIAWSWAGSGSYSWSAIGIWAKTGYGFISISGSGRV